MLRRILYLCFSRHFARKHLFAFEAAKLASRQGRFDSCLKQSLNISFVLIGNMAKQFIVDSRINHWKTPAESPDLNPIENMWHKLKSFIRKHVKPMNKDELVDGIKTFWSGVTKEKCQRYINHLHKVVPAVISKNGNASGY